MNLVKVNAKDRESLLDALRNSCDMIIIDGTPIIMECTSEGTYSNGCIGRCGITKESFKTSAGDVKNLGALGLTRGAGLTNRIVMTARHPSAYGIDGNVPAKFSAYK